MVWIKSQVSQECKGMVGREGWGEFAPTSWCRDPPSERACTQNIREREVWGVRTSRLVPGSAQQQGMHPGPGYQRVVEFAPRPGRNPPSDRACIHAPPSQRPSSCLLVFSCLHFIQESSSSLASCSSVWLDAPGSRACSIVLHDELDAKR